MGYNQITNTLTPFYTITNDANFQKEFNEKYAIFTNTFLNTSKDRKLASHKVYDMIFSLREEEKRKKFKGKLPWVKKKLDQLQKLADDWDLNDTRVDIKMGEFHRDLDQRLAKIRKKRSRIDARNELQSILDGSKPKFDEIILLLVKLENLRGRFR